MGFEATSALRPQHSYSHMSTIISCPRQVGVKTGLDARVRSTDPSPASSGGLIGEFPGVDRGHLDEWDAYRCIGETGFEPATARPQPADGGARCVSTRPHRPRRPRSKPHWSHRTMCSVLRAVPRIDSRSLRRISLRHKAPGPRRCCRSGWPACRSVIRRRATASRLDGRESRLRRHSLASAHRRPNPTQRNS